MNSNFVEATTKCAISLSERNRKQSDINLIVYNSLVERLHNTNSIAQINWMSITYVSIYNEDAIQKQKLHRVRMKRLGLLLRWSTGDTDKSLCEQSSSFSNDFPEKKLSQVLHSNSINNWCNVYFSSEIINSEEHFLLIEVTRNLCLLIGMNMTVDLRCLLSGYYYPMRVISKYSDYSNASWHFCLRNVPNSHWYEG